MFRWAGTLGGGEGADREQHLGPAGPDGDPGRPVDSWGRPARPGGAECPPVATAASLVQSWEEEEGAGAGAAGEGRGAWEAALGLGSGPGAHPGSLAAELGQGALGGLPLQPESPVPGPGHRGRQGLGGPHGSRTGHPGKAASLSSGCRRPGAAGSSARAEARPAPGPSCPSLASLAARRRRRGCFKGRPGRGACPRPAARRLPRRPWRWREQAAPGGAGTGLGEAAAGACERGALCGGGAGTAVRAAPARARSATPRLGTRSGSVGRGQSLATPRSAQGPAPALGLPPAAEARDPRSVQSSAPQLVDPGF